MGERTGVSEVKIAFPVENRKIRIAKTIVTNPLPGMLHFARPLKLNQRAKFEVADE